MRDVRATADAHVHVPLGGGDGGGGEGATTTSTATVGVETLSIVAPSDVDKLAAEVEETVLAALVVDDACDSLVLKPVVDIHFACG